MLTALESFLTSGDIPRDQNEVEKKKTKNEQGSKKINETMASFFAPLPIIISSDDSRKEEGEGTYSNSNQIEKKLNNIEVDLTAALLSKQLLSNSCNPITDSVEKELSSTKNSDVWYVARYGRIYKRKAPSKVGFSHIPCPPGHRYCKECQKPMPIEKFYTNVKRYICRHHHYLRVNKRFRERVLTSDFEKMAEVAWLDLFRVCPILGYAKADYDRHDIKDLVINTKIPLSIAPRAVPIDPSLPMRPRNVAVVSSANMALLLKIYVMTCSRAQYILLVQSVNLLPTNADAGVPWAPYHNPNYVRQDIDVKQILDWENSRPKELPHVEGVWEMMKEDKETLDACKNRLGRAAQDDCENKVEDHIMTDAQMTRVTKEKKKAIPDDTIENDGDDENEEPSEKRHREN